MSKAGKDIKNLSLEEKRKLLLKAMSRSSNPKSVNKRSVLKKNHAGFSTILADFKPISLSPPVPQQKLLDTMAWLMAKANCIKENVADQQRAMAILKEAQAKIDRFGISPDLISQRETNIASEAYIAVAADAFADIEADIFSQCQMPESLSFSSIPLFENYAQDPQGTLLERRMSIYGDVVDKILEKAYPQDWGGLPPDDLIHVTCSGYLAPSPVEKMVSRKEWQETIVTHAYHMGCYGSIPAIRMGAGFLATSHLGLGKMKSRIDVIHTEFLSLHSNMLEQSPGQIVSTSLFADGFIKYSLFSGDSFPSSGKRGIKLLATKESIISRSEEAMSWHLSSHNFKMYLSKNIPILIGDNILSFINCLLQEANLDRAAIKNNLVFALHPGGSKILDVVRVALQLEEQQVAQSRKILFDHGNMSSATIPYILAEIIKDDTVFVGTKVLCLAFGPGLTAAGAIFEKV